MRTVAEFQIEYLRASDPQGTPVGELPAFAADDAELLKMFGAMLRARIVRRQGDQSAAHRQARHLRAVPRPGSHARRRRRGDATGRLPRDRLSRNRHAVLARRAHDRRAALLGRRRARQRFRRSRARFPLVRADRDADAACRRRGHGVQDPQGAALRARVHRRRRHLRRLVLRSDQPRRRASSCRSCS